MASGPAALPEDFVAYVESEVADCGSAFTLIEVGCGDGRVLRRLAHQFPQARFIGTDPQKAAVAKGQRDIADEGLRNVELRIGSCLDADASWGCDFMISRTALIYLNRYEFE